MQHYSAIKRNDIPILATKWIKLENNRLKERIYTPMVFPVVMYGCESWTVKKADCQRIDAFELWC